ncbi:exonuclease [Pedobacter hiemivivus]|jgi:DNA polymerase-3 subunit epsilon|uniref:Exonuclease n=1 Tax=Pedobacter hiemivivus TaxID=2530454 RepID=A0A4R0NGF2_9SPHI|nr:3'-5' exonuclease [Pedobacter hiemivivus]TCC99515.1 exonuclease [Pedobacter hiemivivus]TKC63655.1 exonuclease [Pedobacter hiemivivus]
MEHNFTAIDFETAHGKRWSICQVGLVRVENGIIKETINRLVCPPDNFYFYRNIEVHGITPERTRRSPDFSTVWTEISHFIQGQVVVAHNGAFDFSCLSQTLDYYQIEQPVYNKQCTYKIYGQKLASLCQEYRIPLNHHDALSDALACAELYKRYLNK